MDGELLFTSFDNQQLILTKIVDKYLAEEHIYVDDRLFNFEKSIKNLTNTANTVNKIINDYKPKTKIEYEDKKRVASILDEIRKSMLDFYVYHEIFFKQTEIYKLQGLDKVVSKYSKLSRSAGEIEDQYNELSKY